MWVPLQMARGVATRENHWVSVVARLSPGTTVPCAQAEMTRLMAELEVEFAAANTNRGALVERLADVGRATCA